MIVKQHCHHVDTLMNQMRDVGISTQEFKVRMERAETKIKEVEDQITAMKNAPKGSDPWQNYGGTGPRPQDGQGASSPQAAEQQGPKNPEKIHGDIGPVGNVQSGKLFDDRVALDQKYQYNGSKESGAGWRERISGYLIAKSPALFKLLAWAEAQDRTVISVAISRRR